MANEQGRDWRVKVKSGAAFVAIGGETNLTFKRSRAEQDIGDKDTGDYDATSYGRKKIAIQVSGNLKLPDAGFSVLNAASNASPPHVEVQIVRGDSIRFQGVIAIGNLDATFPKEGLATYSYDLANAAAPTIDDLTGEDDE